MFRVIPLLLALLFSLPATAQVSISLRPRRAPLTLKEKQQFQATVSNTTNTGVTWLVDGVQGGNSTVGIISASGLYTPPSAAGTHKVAARSNADTSKTATATVWVTNYAGTYTYHNDKYHSGLNSQELALTSSTVNQNTFGKVFTRSVDGQIYAQPLYVANLSIGGVYRNVVYVATEHDGVYAFDAEGKTSSPLWRRSFINPTNGITTLSKSSNGLISPEIGITGTPAIDRAGNTLYVVATTVENGTVKHRLHALSLTTGAEKFGGPVLISGSYGGMTFAASRQLQRPALLYLNGNVYICFGSHGDFMPYAGWIFAYSASGGTLHRAGILNTAPSSGAAAIWSAGGGPVADNNGNIYIATGNGAFDLNSGGSNAGDTALKVGWVNGALRILDYYTPDNQATLNSQDWDFGSGGPMLPPYQSGAVAPNLMIQPGKDGVLYLINRSSMGHYSATSDHAVQKLPLVQPSETVGGYFSPANWNGYVYVGEAGDALRAYRFTSGLLSTSPASTTGHTFLYPGTTPSASSNGSNNGIAWALDVSHYYGGTPTGGVNSPGPAVLHAYRADNLGAELYNSAQAGTRDTGPTAIKFTTPTVANGHVYVGGAKVLTVYSLLP